MTQRCSSCVAEGVGPCFYRPAHAVNRIASQADPVCGATAVQADLAVCQVGLVRRPAAAPLVGKLSDAGIRRLMPFAPGRH